MRFTYFSSLQMRHSSLLLTPAGDVSRRTSSATPSHLLSTILSATHSEVEWLQQAAQHVAGDSTVSTDFCQYYAGS